ncbi:uncharacterized protein K460DRAFT_193642 [Cucurbitaria berberidis CBS 394.84]|uniref:Uncharacterized protein n=1 Tax=Cucurbitaria berberidis CBS 394.84 TaxID=1168544 RepID=A0A9P4L420_9PLEO|nr:uncharacterized protein K460DRAFT_193642 [Cucurbitaria berberidis CBS 394.84]KAF1840862.1 hypothetical protein K460DRAFT_193642 [Cucurbitaria berberidis CBS 394.84]
MLVRNSRCSPACSMTGSIIHLRNGTRMQSCASQSTTQAIHAAFNVSRFVSIAGCLIMSGIVCSLACWLILLQRINLDSHTDHPIRFVVPAGQVWRSQPAWLLAGIYIVASVSQPQDPLAYSWAGVSRVKGSNLCLLYHLGLSFSIKVLSI